MVCSAYEITPRKFKCFQSRGRSTPLPALKPPLYISPSISLPTPKLPFISTMPALALTLAFLSLIFAFTFTYARIPFDTSLNDVTDPNPSTSLPESHPNPTLLLPADQLDPSEPTAILDLEPQDAGSDPINDVVNGETDSNAITEDLPVSDTQTIEASPLNRPVMMVRFRSDNRNFPAHRPYYVRIPNRGCRHKMKPKPMKDDRISYSKEMILAGESRGDFNPRMFRGGRNQIPPMWMRMHRHRLHHHHQHQDGNGMQKFPAMRHDDMFGKQSFRRPFHGEDEEEREKVGRVEREENGFMSRFRHDDRFGKQRFKRPLRGEEEERGKKLGHVEREQNGFRDEDMFGKQRFRKPFNGENGEVRGQKAGREEREEPGLMNRFRKFLIQF